MIVRRLYLGHYLRCIPLMHIKLLFLCFLTVILFLNLSFSFTKIHAEQRNKIFEMDMENNDVQTDDSLDLSSSITETAKPVTILLWNPTFVGIPGDMLVGKQSFTACKHLPCTLTTDKSLEATADAIIMPWFERQMFERVPQRSNPKQVLVFETLEGPMINARPKDTTYEAYKGIFNWTMTYRNDADIKKSYGEFYYFDIGERPSLRGIRNMLKNKTRIAAWFVSNTVTAHERYNFVKELKKYVTVDIYGPNQKLKCPTSQWGECLEMVDVHYKFYLSFENTIAKDYVTEKMFSHIGRPVVPVVLGGANYKAIFPPHSYIDVSHFKTVQQLAQYLMYLDKNHNLYMEYFDWMHRGIFKYHQPQWCNLCVNLLTRDEKDNKNFKDINDWYYDDNYWIKSFKKMPSRFEIDKAFGYN